MAGFKRERAVDIGAELRMDLGTLETSRRIVSLRFAHQGVYLRVNVKKCTQFEFFLCLALAKQARCY
jgi:hypothetical protein